MGSVGLLYVGAVLFINGLMLLGKIPGKAAAPMNYFVGIMQVVFPTLLMLQSEGDPAVVLGASGLYLFGFTYLYVALNQTFDLGGEGLGWFSLFVAVVAVVMGYLNFTTVNDPVFGAIWLIWAVLWFLFFLVLGLHRDSLTRTTGWFTVIVAHLTGTIPALLLLTGAYQSDSLWTWVMGIAGALALALSIMLGRPQHESSTVPPPPEPPPRRNARAAV
ncbi:MAG: AmiS/UreI family transporter [Citricoccus sp.]|uniref:AmiS/UreI family transporter n=1 Tax=Citricoccus nitrophenolicus TaxID=863575 RepID=UPI0039B64C13